MDNAVFKNIFGSDTTTHGGIFNDIISLENLFTSWEEFKQGKENKSDIQEFAFNLEDNIFALHQELRDGIYRHGPYQSFCIKDPKLRHIHKACVRDRVVHHAIVRILEPIFDPNFIYDSYSSREEKGTHKAIERFRKFAWKLSQNNTKPVWVLKLDIKKFFDSVDHGILFDLIKKKIRDEKVLWLIEEIITSFNVHLRFKAGALNQRERERERESTGIPLGNVTSQLFANIYLNELDQFVKRELRVKYYVRYCDDFLLIANDANFGELSLIDKYLKEKLNLQLHPEKIILRKWSEGVDFLGYVIFPHFTLLRTKTKKRMFRKIEKQRLLLNQGEINLKNFRQTVMSYMGVCSHARSRAIQKELKSIYKEEYRKNAREVQPHDSS